MAAVVTEDNDNAPVIDRAYLERMAAGDAELIREVLGLFELQSAQLFERMRNSDPSARAVLTHTLKGSALGIGATRVARAAEALERAGLADEVALERVGIAVRTARSVIAGMLAPLSE